MKIRHVLRTAGGLAAGLLLATAIAGTANAASPGPDLAAATAAAHSADATKLIAKASSRVGKATKAAAVVQKDAVPVYALNPQFVTGKSSEVATLWYVATTATKGDAKLTVFTAPDQSTGAWQAVNVATGNTESRMAALAKGAQLFTEPQIDAWYALKGDSIRALNSSAVEAIGAKPVTVDTYRQHVSRYADKQAGSTYSKNGTAGGYDANAAIPTKSSTSFTWLAGGAAAVALAAAAVLYRRRARA